MLIKREQSKEIFHVSSSLSLYTHTHTNMERCNSFNLIVKRKGCGVVKGALGTEARPQKGPAPLRRKQGSFNQARSFA